MPLHAYLEDLDSQIPAIQQLHALGWHYLSQEEALALRNGRFDQVILTGVLHPWLTRHNQIESRGETHLFTDGNIAEAVRRLTDEPFDGLVRSNETIYHLLTLGTSLEQTIAGDRKGRSLQYIDWQHPENNVYHVSDEFAVERRKSHETRRPDLVLFVNGIPFVVIECKRRDRDHQTGKRQIDAAIEQLLGYQNNYEIPHLFQYAQLLIGTAVNAVRYGTVGTPRKFWSVWKEEDGRPQAVHASANQRLPAAIEAKMFAPREVKHAEGYRDARQHFDALWAAGDRLPTAQDELLWAMLRPQRLLEFVHGYVVFDAGVRKVARYQQFFSVREALRRVENLREGRREGGVIWHTTGSGKSLTMVMLAKALALHPGIADPRVVLVTDRVDLDRQIWRTFEACGKSAVRARTGQHLVQLITESKAGVITTVIDKFQTAVNKQGLSDDNPNIFVLVDEGHRSNYGETATMMRRVFPNACYIGFTGTPLLKKDRHTVQRFGGFIHRYTMRDAVLDQAVTPLLYEGRVAALEQNKPAMDAWFKRVTDGLSDAQVGDLKKKMTRKEEIHKAEQRLKMIAFDIGRHYRNNFQGTGFKAQLAADSRDSAIAYRRFFRDFGDVETEVVMSQPDLRGGAQSTADEDTPRVQQFWKEMMDRFGSEKTYNKELLSSFAREDGVEILVVVDKLLTGFDEPRNTVLYIDKPLKGHNILQAIARVNRLYPNKEFGYIVDYRGVLGELNEAMQTYDALADFDPADVDLSDAVVDTHEEVSKLPQRHSDLWAVFKQVPNKQDTEALEQHLAPEDRRQDFYQALRGFQQTLAVALSTEHFFADTPKEKVQRYKDDLKFFVSLRSSVQQRYSETIDYSQYEKQIRKVMDDHIQAPDVAVITDMVNIFDQQAFDAEVERLEGAAAKADTIASRVARTITERMDQDPVFYTRFAELVQRAIDDYRQQRIDELEYLKRIREYLETVRRGHEADVPAELRGHTTAQAYFGVLGEILERYPDPAPEVLDVADDRGAYTHKGLAARMALDIEGIIAERRIRDWIHNEDVQRRMKDDVDDYLFELHDKKKLHLQTEDMDAIIDRCLDIARKQAGG